jgi:hypothetical protein
MQGKISKNLRSIRKSTEKAQDANFVEDPTKTPASNAAGTGGKVPIQSFSKGKAMEDADS